MLTDILFYVGFVVVGLAVWTIGLSYLFDVVLKGFDE
jgi:hypothetical protein